MKCKILGSGGAIPTPRPFTNSKVSQLAKEDLSLQRDSSCFWIEDSKTLIDCPESVWNSANKTWITDIENLFITHWHPDHTFWLRLVLESKYNFYTQETINPLNLYIPKSVYEDIKKVYPSIDFFINVKKCANITRIKDWDTINLGSISIEVIGYTEKDPHRYAYLIRENNKSILYLPCDTIWFEKEVPKVDILIHECGIFSPEVKHELSFQDLLKRIDKAKPWKTILTHIEEIEMVRHEKEIININQKYKDKNIVLAYDGMNIEL